MRAACAVALCAGALTPMPRIAMAQELVAKPLILQWFELSWRRMERRIPDFFMAGYDATWVAPVSKASDPTSPGFDVFDRFDLGFPNVSGQPNNETIYGTEQGFRATIDELHRANGLIYVDSVMNHNSGRNGSASFIAEGGFPGFWMNPPGPKTVGSGNWGDFHNGAFQSHDPNGGSYNLWDGDLVSLIDIDQSSDNRFIRHPVDPDDPENLPEGTLRNLSDPANARFYPDMDLPHADVMNPGKFRAACCGFGSFNSPAETTQVWPFNTVDPMQGDTVSENATSLLTRWTQWMLEEMQVDGFRLDASKHIPPWFWDRYWDTVVFNRRLGPDGNWVTPYSFGENVEGNTFVNNYYIRRDGFGNRDGLDLSGAGTIRNVIGARGSDSAANIDNDHLDTFDDGFNNGTIGTLHIHSHDNGSNGNGGSAPDWPFEDKIGYWAYAYMLMRPGPAIVYLNAREMHDRFTMRGGFWPREGVSTALGRGRAYRRDPYVWNCSGMAPAATHTLVADTVVEDRIPALNLLSKRYGRGWFVPRAIDDSVYIYERQTPSGVGNVLVGVNAEWNSCTTNFDSRTFNTAFPQGTVLVELTGNATNSSVDPLGQIFDTITVGVGGSVTIRVPRNTSRSGTDVHTEHARGYVVYGPATPQGVLEIRPGGNPAAIVLPPDSNGTAVYARRLASIDVVQTPTFDILLTTNKDGYPVGDLNYDDTAIFRINQGFADYNGQQGIEQPGDIMRPWDVTIGEFRGFEGFVTERVPLYGTANTNGIYRQTVSTDLLPEGYNYINVLAFRQRTVGPEAGGMPLYGDFRRVIYIDRQPTDLSLILAGINCTTGTGVLRFRNDDRTATRIHVFIDQPIGTLTLGNQATPYDRLEWNFNVFSLSQGMHTANVRVIEEPSPGVIVRQTDHSFQFEVGALRGDVNGDGLVNLMDLHDWHDVNGFQCEADLNIDGVVNGADDLLLQDMIRSDADEIGDITTQTP